MKLVPGAKTRQAFDSLGAATQTRCPHPLNSRITSRTTAMVPQIPKAPNSHRQDSAPNTATFLASHLHSGVLAGVSYACFQSLVDDPPSALLSTLPLLAFTQITYVLFCLEPGGSGSKGKRLRASKKGENTTVGISSRVLVSALSLRREIPPD